MLSTVQNVNAKKTTEYSNVGTTEGPLSLKIWSKSSQRAEAAHPADSPPEGPFHFFGIFILLAFFRRVG